MEASPVALAKTPADHAEAPSQTQAMTDDKQSVDDPSSAANLPVETASSTETTKEPARPELPADTVAEVKNSPSLSPGRRGRPRKTSTPSTPQKSATVDATCSTSPTAANDTNGTTATDDAASAQSPQATPTTTRSGRRVTRPKKALLDEIPPPTKRSRAVGKGTKTTPSAAAAAAADTTTTTNAVTSAMSPTVTAAVKRRRRAEAARWETAFLLSDPRSPLTKFDVRSILLRPETWDALNPDEQTEVLSLFPSTNDAVTGTDAAPRPDCAALINDNNFRHDCARYQTDLAEGFFERSWLAGAFEAHAMRRAGLFRAYEDGEFESAWGVRVPRGSEPAVAAEAEADAAATEEPDEMMPTTTTDTKPSCPSPPEDGASVNGVGEQAETPKQSLLSPAKERKEDGAQEKEEAMEVSEETPPTPTPAQTQTQDAAKGLPLDASNERENESPTVNGNEENGMHGNADESTKDGNDKKSNKDSNSGEAVTDANVEDVTRDNNAEETTEDDKAEENAKDGSVGEAVRDGHDEEPTRDDNAKETIKDGKAEETARDDNTKEIIKDAENESVELMHVTEADAPPADVFSLRLGSPILDDDYDDGDKDDKDAVGSAAMAVNAKEPTPVHTTNPARATRRAPAKRKVTATATQSRRKRRTPNMEAKEEDNE